jgi:hypothetical protein
MKNFNKNPFGFSDDSTDPASWPVTDPGAGGFPAAVTDPGAAGVEYAVVGDIARKSTPVATVKTTSGTAPAPTQVTSTSSGLVINLDWDASVGSAPTGFMTDVVAAAQYLESQLSNAVTITLNVGYDEVGGSALESGALGESESNIESVSYKNLYNALSADATDATDTSVLASLPSPASGSPVAGTFWVTTAQAKALGLAAANGTSADGDIGFGASSEFSYGDTNAGGTVANGTYDFFATAAHEMTEVMGRIMLVGESVDSATSYTLLDTLHYSASGTRDFTQSTPGYFSVNGGATDLGNFNTVAGGDPGDWASAPAANAVPDDSFDAYATPGVIEAVSANDMTEMDAIGWNPTSGTGTGTPPSSTSTPTGVSVSAATASLAAAQGSRGLTAKAVLARFAQTGGAAADTYSYTLGGSGDGSFSLTTAGNVATLAVGASTAAGATNGRLYALKVTANDTSSGNSSPAEAVNVVVGGSGNDTITLASLSGIVAAAPTFIFGLAGNDTINGTGMTGKLYFDGGAGADTMTGGSGVNDYEYGAVGDSTRTAMDIIKNFNVAVDLIDLTGIGTKLNYTGAIASTTLAADSIGFQASGGNTFVYVNSGAASEKLTATNMKIELQGSIALTTANFVHL